MFVTVRSVFGGTRRQAAENDTPDRVRCRYDIDGSFQRRHTNHLKRWTVQNGREARRKGNTKYTFDVDLNADKFGYEAMGMKLRPATFLLCMES